MNPQIEKLYQIAQKPSRIILGLMSGTSLDGLDMALCKITGAGNETKVELLNFTTTSYTVDFKQKIKNVFAKTQVDFEYLIMLNEYLGIEMAKIINETLQTWGLKATEIDAIASHGQTVFHAPKIQHNKAEFTNATLQIADGDHIAVNTGIITLSDFRQKHIAMGGEGAPLAAYADFLLFNKIGTPRILMNLGGIANFTFLPGHKTAQSLVVTDTGPSNTILDAYVQKHFAPLQYDKEAQIALAGEVNAILLNSLLAHSFFSKPLPKSTGPEVFNLNFLQSCIDENNLNNLSHKDIVATLSQFSVNSIAKALEQIVADNENLEILLSGGGAHNPFISNGLKIKYPKANIRSTNSLNINGDAKEAILFAILANETLAGSQKIFGFSSNMPQAAMGKISLPY